MRNIERKNFLFLDTEICIKTTNYIPKYLDRKQSAKPFLIPTQNIHNP